ncbi:MAG TPA: hypothetical protein VHB48_17570 [Chitinophagaceae bacterium]|nr:hypothetical protein [Chitinophagaceae bacterium]
MKIALIIVLAVLAFSFRPPKKGFEDFSYYFCESRMLSPDPVTGKVQVLYTRVKASNPAEANAITKKWGAYVNAAGKGRTSDADFYATLQKAEYEKGLVEKKYSDTAKYQLILVKF